MNLKKEIYKKQNIKDYSLKAGAIKSAKDNNLYGLLIKDICVKKGGII